MILILVAGISAFAQPIAVNPSGVNVNSQGATTVFLTFGPIPPGYSPAEAIWCGELMPATPPAIGLQCVPTTIFGSLPARLNRSTMSGMGGFTDIMGIPPSVARRAYQAAQAGSSSSFFYVRRFVSASGPDQFVNVTCRMAGGGARVPFSLTNVDLKTASGEPILFLNGGEKLPEIVADIQYNGMGRLKGRWEFVQPGEDPPSDRDLLTEATLPIEQRGTQRRFSQISRFNHFLPPTGRFRIKLESPERVPIIAAGQYMLLLRIEVVDDKEGDSDLAALGVGPGIVNSGAVASFPMPTLKFFVSAGDGTPAGWAQNAQILPKAEAQMEASAPVVFTWREMANVSVYRLELLDDDGSTVLTALILPPITQYRAPPWLYDKAAGARFRWRVAAVGQNGERIAESTTRAFTIK